MYSFWQRIGTVFSFFTSCLFVILPLIAALNFAIKREDPYVSLVVDNVSNRLGVEDYFMNQRVMLTDLVLNLEAGIFCLISRNQIVFWDKIIRVGDNKRLSISNLKSKYPSVDIDDQLPGKEATIKLRWNTISHVGHLFDTQKGQVAIKIPGIGQKFVRLE